MATIIPTQTPGIVTGIVVQLSIDEFKKWEMVLLTYSKDPNVIDLVNNTINPALASAGLPPLVLP